MSAPQRRGLLREIAPLLLVAGAALAASHALQSRVGVLSQDSYYHFRHAEHLRRAGLADGSFPWLPRHVMGREGADIWYGFHVLLVPATFAADPLQGIEIAGTVLTALLLVASAVALRALDVPGWWAWPAVGLLAAPSVLSHSLMARPHVASLALALLSFSATVRGRSLMVALLAFLTAWIHLSLVWLVALVGVAVLVVRATRRERPWREVMALLDGLVLGIAARPNPLGALRIAKVQLLDLTLAKVGRVPLDLGQELLPLPSEELGGKFLPLVLLWALSVGLALFVVLRRLAPSRSAGIVAAALLSTGFLAISLALFRRAYDPWAAFSVVLAAQVVAALCDGRSPWARRAAPLLPQLLAGALASWSVRPVLAQRERTIDHYRPVAAWIAADGGPGDLVYHVEWFSFAPFMFLLPDRRFSAGIDPVFTYAHDPSLYWRSYHLRMGDVPGGTCGAPRCEGEPVELISTFLARDFGARYLVVESRSHASARLAEGDPGLERALQQDLMIVYRVRSQEAP